MVSMTNDEKAAVTYLDYAATAPLRPEVLESYLEDLRYLALHPGNPNALHVSGRAAREMLEDARARIAHVIGADAPEVLFTSGATEANNLAVLGTLRAVQERGAAQILLTDGLEHPAISKLGERCVENGGTHLQARVTSTGVIDPEDVQRLCATNAVAVASFMAVSNEIGTVQPVVELATIAHQFGVGHVHCDAAQGAGHIPMNFHEWGLDSMSFSGHKFGAPGGIGALIIRRAVPLVSDRLGGGQERSLRSGTQDVAGARALAHALELAHASMADETRRLEKLHSRLVHGLDARATLTTPVETAPHIVHLTIPTSHPEVILMVMDQAGVAVSAGSACHAGVARPSSALMSMGRTEEEAMGALRVSFGWGSTAEDVDAFLAALTPAIDAAQRFERGRH